MVDLQIQQRFGRIGLQIPPLQFNLTQTPGQFEMTVTPPELQTQKTPSDINIDSSPFRESLGLYAIYGMMQRFTQEAFQEVSQGIDRRVSQGNRMARIDKNVSIGDLERQWQQPIPKELTFQSTAPPQINFTPEQWAYSLQWGSVQTDADFATIQVDSKVHPIQVYLEQKSELTITANGQIYDQTI